ncbi:MAG: sugar phosphate nucleotidyltransferase [bacterium]|nr:sugar phosphate nucleotidyltransferase [bacterium]
MQKNEDLAVIIMAGGAGTRFWPLSTEERPKQFLKLFGERSLLQKSFDRVAGLVPFERILVLTNEAFVKITREQLPMLPEGNIIGEPMRRDTAAAAALAALLCRNRFGNCTMAIMTADHIIEPVDAFQKTLLSAARGAKSEGAIYTFGIEPAYAATGYGYLETSDQTANDGGVRHFRLKRFKEKPDLATAEEYIKSGRFLWNSGMFLWQADTIIGEFKRQLPAHIEAIAPAIEKDGSAAFPDALRNAFGPLEKTSVDFAIMENAVDVRCVESTFSWSDVGGWPAMEEFMAKDKSGNSCRGDVKTYDATSNIVFCEDEDETVALVGVKDLIVVRTGGKTLIVGRDRAEDIKKLVEGLDDSLK